jgi:hypothetical protein
MGIRDSREAGVGMVGWGDGVCLVLEALMVLQGLAFSIWIWRIWRQVWVLGLTEEEWCYRAVWGYYQA